MIHIETGVTATAKPMVLVENLLASGTLTASTAATGFEGANAVANSTYDGWQPTTMPATLSVALSAADSADCIGIAAHNLGTSGATVIVEYLDGTWQEAASYAPADDSTIIILFPEQSSDEWRIRLTGATAPTINFVMLGKRIDFAAGIVGDYVPTNWAAEVEILGGETVSGQFLGQRVIRRGAEARVNVGRVARTWAETTGQAFFDRFNNGLPFFFAGWPAGLPNDVAMCWRGELGREINPTIGEGGFVNIAFDARCYVAT